MLVVSILMLIVLSKPVVKVSVQLLLELKTDVLMEYVLHVIQNVKLVLEPLNTVTPVQKEEVQPQNVLAQMDNMPMPTTSVETVTSNAKPVNLMKTVSSVLTIQTEVTQTPFLMLIPVDVMMDTMTMVPPSVQSVTLNV